MKKILIYLLMISIGILGLIPVFLYISQPAPPEYLSNESLALPLRLLNLGVSPYTTVNPANTISSEVHSLYGTFTWVGVGILSIVVFWLVLVVFLFREKKHPVPLLFEVNPGFEIFLNVFPIIILIIIGLPTMRLLFKIREIPEISNNAYIFASTPEVKFNRVLDVSVIGHQWWWEFEYTNWREVDQLTGEEKIIPINKVTANEPLFPVNIPVNLTLTSEDVIHSLWLPRISGKKDVMPGRVVEGFGWIFEKQGSYAGECALYCGVSHASMKFNAHAVNMKEFEDWLNWGKGEINFANESARRGYEYSKNCMSCHTMNGVNTFISRKERFNESVVNYEEMIEKFNVDVVSWEESSDVEHKHMREIVNDPTRPHKPIKPKLYNGALRTVAPDLTDLRYRAVILGGLRENNRENLMAWIKNPSAVKLDIDGTPTIRMPAYQNLYSENVINDVIEFLLTVKYNESKVLTKMKVNYDRPITQTSGVVESDGHNHDDHQH